MLYLFAFQLGIADSKAGIALLALAVPIENIETDGDASAESPIAALARGVHIVFIKGIAIARIQAQVRIVARKDFLVVQLGQGGILVGMQEVGIDTERGIP